MRISKIIVENYRSIEKAEIEPNKLSIFVGQNNHGKTSFFEAIAWFYNSKSTTVDERHMRDSSKIIRVEIFYEDVIRTDIDKLSAETNRTKIENLLGDETSFSILKSSSDHKRKYLVNGEDKGNPSGLDTAINEFIPKLEYINTKIRLDDVSKYSSKNPIGQMLSGIFERIIETTPEYIDFQQKFSELFDGDDSQVRVKLDELGQSVQLYLERQFPDGSAVTFRVNPPQFTDLLKSFDTTVDDGIDTKAEDKGDGMQRAIMLSIIQSYADYRKNELGGGTFLFMIDEAELHLHPSAQRALKIALLEIAKTDQVLINTHSSVFVADDHELQKSFKVLKSDKITDIQEVRELDKLDLIYDLLGGSPADLLLPNNFLIVEGKTEYFFIKSIIERFYGDEYNSIKIIFGGGDITQQERGIIAIHEMLKPIIGDQTPVYKDKVVILLDKPNDAQQNKYKQFKAGYPYLFDNKQVFELTENSLEEYFPSPWTKTADEVKQMEKDKIKVEYAKQVAAEMSHLVFEKEMPIVFSALKRCKDLSF